MSISFTQVPANWQLPLVHIEVDASQAGTRTLVQPALLVGQKFAAGTAPADQIIAIASLAQAKSAFGEGSMLERMVAAFLANNLGAMLYCGVLVEPGAGVAATGKIAVSSAPTAAGVITLYIGGQKCAVAVLGTETTSQTATKIAAAINAMASLPVTAIASTADVNLTCRWKGLTGNDILLSDSYEGSIGGEALPTGLALTYTAMSGGTGAPSMTTLISAIGDDTFDYVAMPFTDATSLGAWATEYGFSDAGRWGWMRQTYGTIFSAKRDTYANLLSYGPTQNSPVVSMMAVEAAAPSPVWEWAAAYTARAARALLNDPARPLQTLEFDAVLPAKKGARFSKTERNNLAQVGMAVQTVSANSKPMIEREVTQYQLNVYGQGDSAYHDVTTLHTLAYIFRFLRQRITSKFPRHKLANDGTRFGPGQAIVTPNIIKAELVTAYRLMEYDGIVENADAFKANLLVERDNNDPNRVNVLYPPDLVNQLRIFAVLGQFRLQYSTVEE